MTFCLALALTAAAELHAERIPGHVRQSLAGTAPDARELLSEVVSGLPVGPLQLTGRLVYKSGDPDRRETYNLLFEVDRCAPESRLSYTVSERDGSGAQSLVVRWRAEGAPRYSFDGDFGTEQASGPDLGARVKRTNVTWADLSLAYLWWKNVVLERDDTLKGRACYVVRLQQQPAVSSSNAGGEQYRLWIDKTFRMLLRAECCDKTGVLRRRLTVRSVKRTGDTWMIRDLTIRSYPSGAKTELIVESVEPTG